MTSENFPAGGPPSKRSIAKATLLALLVAAAILVTVVLPAEYAIDPLGTGAALGLLDLSQAAEADSSAPVSAIPVQTGTYMAQTQKFKRDAREISLAPGEGIEIKYHMAKGAGMVYAWESTAKVFFEFHGEPDEKPNPDYYDSYELDDQEGKSQSYGSFTAPSTGIHGWFWENVEDKDVKIRLTTAGFYDHAIRYTETGPVEIPLQEVE